jgi:hypothetical protein
MRNGYEFVQDTGDYVDYEQVLDVGDEWTFCFLRASWDTDADSGYTHIFATTDGGATILLDYTFPHSLTRAEFTALTGHTFEEPAHV